MPWYQNPTIAALLGGLVGAIITSIVSVYIWKKTHKIKRVDGIIGDITSLLTFSEKIKDQLEIKFSGSEAKAVYLFSIDISNSGTEAVESHPVNIRLDESSNIVDYSISTEPEIGFGDIKEKRKEGNILDLEIALLNPDDSVSIEIVSLDNTSEQIDLYMKNANVQTRVYSRKSVEKQLTGAFMDREMLSLAVLSTIPIIGGFAKSMMTVVLAKRIDKISTKTKSSHHNPSSYNLRLPLFGDCLFILYNTSLLSSNKVTLSCISLKNIGLFIYHCNDYVIQKLFIYLLQRSINMTTTDTINIGLLFVQTVALIAIVATVCVYFFQLKTMQAQLKVILSNESQTHHKEFIKLAIEDPDLLEVWHASHSDLQCQDFKRHLFVNLCLSDLKSRLDLGIATKEKVINNITHHSKNPYYRAFWSTTRTYQKEGLNHSKPNELWFFNLCEDNLYKRNT